MPKMILAISASMLIVLLLTSCRSNDERLVKVATESSQRQAEQNRQMAQLQQEVAAGARALVEAEAQARQDQLVLQQQLQAERSEIGRQRDQLEAERRALALQPRQDSMIAAAIANLGLLLACLLPLVLCWYLLRLALAADEPALSNLLIQELVAERPLLLPPHTPTPALSHQAGDRSSDSSGEGPPKIG